MDMLNEIHLVTQVEAIFQTMAMGGVWATDRIGRTACCLLLSMSGVEKAQRSAEEVLAMSPEARQKSAEDLRAISTKLAALPPRRAIELMTPVFEKVTAHRFEP